MSAAAAHASTCVSKRSSYARTARPPAPRPRLHSVVVLHQCPTRTATIGLRSDRLCVRGLVQPPGEPHRPVRGGYHGGRFQRTLAQPGGHQWPRRNGQMRPHACKRTSTTPSMHCKVWRGVVSLYGTHTLGFGWGAGERGLSAHFCARRTTPRDPTHAIAAAARSATSASPRAERNPGRESRGHGPPLLYCAAGDKSARRI